MVRAIPEGGDVLTLTITARTDVGLVRKNNEDHHALGDGWACVADGLGGRAAGEVASTTACAVVRALIDRGVPLVEAVGAAHDAVRTAARANPDLEGMGTTMTAVAFERDTCVVAHVGDSAAFLLRDGDMRRLTPEHTVAARLVEEGRITSEQAATSPQRHRLTRVVGLKERIEVWTDRVQVRGGDRLLLCSDGLTGPVDDADIAKLLGSDVPADALIAAARDGGAPDNVTVVVLDVA